MAKDVLVDIEGKHLKVSNLDKVLYPEAGFTKGQVHRLLRAHGAGVAAAFARPPADHEALPQRRQQPVFLREELPGASSRVGKNRPRLE